MGAPLPDDLVQYHLASRGCSLKGVRCRKLSPHDLDTLLASAAKSMSADSTGIELARMEQKLGVQAMLVAVTKAPVSSTDAALAGDVAWEPFDPHASQLNAKDWQVLMAIYHREYSVSNTDIEAIMGKAQTVSAG